MMIDERSVVVRPMGSGLGIDLEDEGKALVMPPDHQGSLTRRSPAAGPAKSSDRMMPANA